MALVSSPFPSETLFLVTGAAGFIGSHLVGALLSLGYRVRGVDNFLTGKRENTEPFDTSPLFQFVEGDIRDTRTCSSVCDGADYVLHQAALGSVPRSITNPVLYEEINIGGTLKMMDAAKTKNVKRFVYASSSSVYGDSTRLPKVEGEEGRPLSPYAITKASNELYANYYCQTHGLPTVGLRYFNVFGPRQDPSSDYAAVIPRFIATMLAREPVVIYGDGEQSRDFTYIDNVIHANLQACLAPEEANGHVFNIACGESVTINQLYSTLCLHLGEQPLPIFRPSRPGDVKASLADISKSRSCLGYSPFTPFTVGLEQTAEWYMARQECNYACR